MVKDFFTPYTNSGETADIMFNSKFIENRLEQDEFDDVKSEIINNIFNRKCPECENTNAEFIKEDLRAQGSIATFKCTKCKCEFKERY